MQDTVIYWQVKGEMRLRVIDYVIADVIRQHSKKTGWCELSKKDIGSICGVPERGLYIILSRLEKQGYIERVTNKEERDSRVRTTPVYNAFFPTEDSGDMLPESKEDADGSARISEEAFKIAAESMREVAPEVDEKEKQRRRTIQPMVSEINLYAEKLYKNPIRVENLRPDEWHNLRKVCETIGDKRYVAPALGKLYQLGALGGGTVWWFKGMAKEIELVMDFCRQEAAALEKYLPKENPDENPVA